MGVKTVCYNKRTSNENSVLMEIFRCMTRGYKTVVGKPEGKRPLERHRRRWNQTKTDLKVIWWGGMDWIYLARDRDQWRIFVNTVMTLQVP
jgi:hypothetical protein